MKYFFICQEYRNGPTGCWFTEYMVYAGDITLWYSEYPKALEATHEIKLVSATEIDKEEYDRYRRHNE